MHTCVHSYSFFNQFLRTMTLTLTLTGAVTLIGSTGRGEGSGHGFEAKTAEANPHPAERFAGQTPVDLKNGLCFNNGTFGKPNPEITKWAQSPTWAVSLSELNYSYEDRTRFVSTLSERIAFYETAIWNWGRVSENTKPEAKEYAEKATAEIKPRLERAREAWTKAKSAGRKDWDQASSDAKHAFLDLQSYYYSLHRNTGRSKAKL